MNLLDAVDVTYHAYLLRLRHMDNGGHPIWVYSLESPDGNVRHEFRTLRPLTAFLAQQTQADALDAWPDRSASRP